MKATLITYWTLFNLFSLAMLMDGVASVTREQTGQDVMRHLGYPVYTMVIIGIATFLGVLALWQPRSRTLSEWAFASWLFVDRQLRALAAPLVMLSVLSTLYMMRKRLAQTKNYSLGQLQYQS